MKDNTKGGVCVGRKFEVVSRSIKYENPWMRVYELAIERDGSPGIYGCVERQDSVAVIVRDERQRILLLKQFRFPVQSYSWELPMGGIDGGESAELAARRELFEETGLKPAEFECVGVFRPIPGLTSQLATVFVTVVDSVQAEEIIGRATDEDEIVDRQMVTPEKLKRMIDERLVIDGFTLSSLALLQFK